MPAPDPRVYLDEGDAPQANTNLGANPWCSNCGDDLAGRGGILCRSCYISIYEGASHEPELSVAEIALLVEHAKPWYSWYYYPSTCRDKSHP